MESLLETISELIKLHGVMTVLAVFMLWKFSRDYDNVCAKLAEMELFIRDTLLGTVEATAKVVQQNTDAIKKCKKDDQ